MISGETDINICSLSSDSIAFITFISHFVAELTIMLRPEQFHIENVCPTLFGGHRTAGGAAS